MNSVINPNAHLTNGPRLARNTIWNLVGNAAPMIVAIFCIPALIKGLGADRFGVLTIMWALIGYATLFDLGLGRALTQLVAQKLGDGQDREIPTLVWTSLVMMLLLGIVGAVAVVLLSPSLVHIALKGPDTLERETVYSLYLLGFSVPVVISTAGLRGLLEAYQRFGVVNALRIPMGVFTFVGPVIVLPFSRNLIPVVGVLFAARVIACAAHFVCCINIMPTPRPRIVWQRAAIGPLLRFGGWMTISNVVGPMMVTLDRFLIGALLSVGAVTYYSIPYEVITKLWIVPTALLGVMFPAFSTCFVQDRNRTALLYLRSVKYLSLTLFPLILLVIVLADDGLKLWLGDEFARHSARVLQWLAVGVFINCLAQAPFAMVQGAGRPDLTAKLHLLELPAYLAALFWLIKACGIEGAAMAWTGRAAVDALILFVVARRFLPVSPSVKSGMPLLLACALGTLALAALPNGLVVKTVFLLLALAGFVLVTWFVVLSPEERNIVQEIP